MVNLEELYQIFGKIYGACNHQEVYFSPGRVNLIGEHLDYNGGLVMPLAINRGITAVFVPDQSCTLDIYSLDFQDKMHLSWERKLSGDFDSSWRQYIAASLEQILKRKLPLRGGKVLLKSDLPVASGLSSSAALECLFLYLSAPEFYDTHRLELALDAQHAEIEGMGVQCGIMDQYAIAFGRQGQTLLLDCEKMSHEYVPFQLGNYSLIVVNTRQPRKLQNSLYNERRKECEKALQIIQRTDPTPNLAQAHLLSVGAIEDDLLYFRAKHVVTEQQRVMAAVDALELNRIDYLGNLLWQSHQSLDEDFEVAGEALNTVIQYSKKFRHCIGARMTGAGFGGCAIALVEKGTESRYESYVGKKYRENLGIEADFFIIDACDGVKRIR